MTFTVLDSRTGERPDLTTIAREERWARGLNVDSAAFVIGETGWVFLTEEYGCFRGCPAGRFEFHLDKDH